MFIAIYIRACVMCGFLCLLFSIRNNKLDQLQDMSEKWLRMGFELMPTPTSDVHWNRGRNQWRGN